MGNNAGQRLIWGGKKSVYDLSFKYCICFTFLTHINCGPVSWAVFYKDNTEIGRIKDPAFSVAFFNIWLGDKTSAPELRRKLLGEV